jgi:peptide-methionine (R)-S-oxide reductase
MINVLFTRRRLLVTAASTGAALSAGLARAEGGVSQLVASPFRYEVERSETEWRELLADDEYAILRAGETEWPTTSPLWNDYTAGDFGCRGCGLYLYSSTDRATIEKGWVFFFHSQPDAVLTDIDRGNPYTMATDPEHALIEVHCRRCASHLGHILVVEGQLVHCINGTSLSFYSET